MLSKPIKYRGYTLRYKTPQEWEDFGRQNPHIDPKFWDSPILSKGGTDFSNGPIVSNRRRTRSQQRAGNTNAPPGTTEYAKAYAENYTAEKNARRRKQAKDRAQPREEGANRNYAPAANTNRAPKTKRSKPFKLSGSAVNLLASTAMKVRATAVSLRLGAAMMSMYVGIQLPLYLLGLILFVAAVFDMFLTMGIFTAFAIGLNGINTGICWIFMAFAAISYTLSGINWFGGQKASLKILFFMMAFVGYGATLFQFLPWALPWMIVVARNPE